MNSDDICHIDAHRVLSRLEFRVAAWSQRQRELPTLRGVDFYDGGEILKPVLMARRGDQRAGTVHANAVEEAGDDQTFTPIQPDHRHLGSGNDLTRAGAVEIAIDDVPQGDDAVAGWAPGIA